MSNIFFDNGSIILHDAFDKPRSLVTVGDWAANKSDLRADFIFYEVTGTLKNFFDQQPADMINAIIFLRVVNELLRKPQIHDVLIVGQRSRLDEALEKTLPKFNEKNFLYCYVPHRPIGKFNHVNFICAETDAVGGGYCLPENKFASTVFQEYRLPPPEVFLATKDFGTVYFAAPQPSGLQDFFEPFTQTFDLEKNFALFELKVTPSLKREIRRRTPQGQLDDKKNQIVQTVLNFQAAWQKFNTAPWQEKNTRLDEYIAEVTRAEKLLAEIFPELHSDTIKYNFNLFKEFLIDFRLYSDWQMKHRALEDLNRHMKDLMQDLNAI